MKKVGFRCWTCRKIVRQGKVNLCLKLVLHTVHSGLGGTRRFPRRRGVWPFCVLQSYLLRHCRRRRSGSFFFLFLLLKSSFRNGEKERAIEPILLTVLTQRWVGIWQDVTSVLMEVGQQTDGDRDPKRTAPKGLGKTRRHGPLQIVAKERRSTDRILRLRQLSHALCVLVRFLVSGGSWGCALALGADAITLGAETDAPAPVSSEPSPSLP